MERTLRCRCGALRGMVETRPECTRLVCYCKDCQAFARFLGDPGDILDALGGSEVIGVHPQQVRLTEGRDKLACMSLSDKGMLRWYASCCRTPIGNTSRSAALAYVGLLHTCIDTGGESFGEAFGPVRLKSMTASARGKVEPSGLAALPTLMGFAGKLLRARLTGSYRRTPFFSADGAPVVAPQVLTPAERSALSA